jgi:hypothetical protein
MIYAYILVPLFCLLLGGTLGYLAGRYQVALLDKIRTLEERGGVEPDVPEAPGVTMGDYQPPHIISNVVDTKRAAGLVETKTPERLDWENQQEIEKLGVG